MHFWINISYVYIYIYIYINILHASFVRFKPKNDFALWDFCVEVAEASFVIWFAVFFVKQNNCMHREV